MTRPVVLMIVFALVLLLLFGPVVAVAFALGCALGQVL